MTSSGETTRPARWPALAVFGVSAALYAATAPRRVAFEDDGGFILAAYFASTAHPPGYPLYVLLTAPLAWLPLGSVAWRVHLASGLFGAAACALLWWIARGLVARGAAAWAAALGFALSPVFWSQAIVAEVYTLNALLFFGLLALCDALARAPDAPGARARATALGLLYGASLSNHWPLIALATPCLLLVLWPGRRALWRHLPLAALAGAVGLAPYAWMGLRSRADPGVSFYGPFESVRDLLRFAARSGYPAPGAAGDAGWRESLRFAGFLGREIAAQFTPPGAVLAGVGALAQWRRWGFWRSAGLSAGFLAASVGLAAVLRPDTQPLSLAVFRVFPLIPYGVMALWLALGLDVVAGAIARRSRRAARIAAPAAAALLVAGELALGLPTLDRRDFRYAHDYAAGVLESLPPGAHLFTSGDSDTFTLGYLHLVEGVRPDVELYNDKGLVFPNRIFHPLAPEAEKRARLREHAERHPSVFFVGPPPAGLAVVDLGFYRRARRSAAGPEVVYRVEPELLALFRRLAGAPDDGQLWTRWHRDTIVRRFTRVLAERAAGGGGERTATLRAELERAFAARPSPDNPAAVSLLRLHALEADLAAYRALRRRLYGEGPVPEEVRALDRRIGAARRPR